MERKYLTEWKKYLKEGIKFPVNIEDIENGAVRTLRKINEAAASEDLLTKDMVAMEMIGAYGSAERASAFKKFEVKDSKGKSLGTPSDYIEREPANNDIYLRYKITLSYLSMKKKYR